MLPCSEFNLSLFVQISSNECSIPPFFFLQRLGGVVFVFLFGGDLSSPNDDDVNLCCSVCGCGCFHQKEGKNNLHWVSQAPTGMATVGAERRQPDATGRVWEKL